MLRRLTLESGFSMTDITLIFPDQLFLKHPGIASKRKIYLVEEFLFYKVQPFHKQRLVLLRLAMQKYADMLRGNHSDVIYVPSNELSYRGSVFELLGKKRIKNIHLCEFADEWLTKDLMIGAEKYGWNLHFYPSPGFICSNQELKTHFGNKKHFSMAQFYAYQRKSQNILMEDERPVGGKYSFDADNRKKIPKNLSIPPTFIPKENANTEKIIAEVDSEFTDAIGEADPFLYPTTHQEARKALDLFLKDKLVLFGAYQDAIQKEESFLFHSVLSPLLNIGLLTPHEVIQAALHHSKKHSVPLNSLEGFLRQIMGWREFVRASYLLKGSYQRSINYFQHHTKIPKKFWEGKTGILPIDTTVKRALQTGYCNHIERLMVLGNFLLLTEAAPDEIYKWFMGFFVDAYDWVMVPNVYGMSQYADGGVIITKPYISSSNYILKMSNYPKGDWTEIWDGLFWRFVDKHRSLFSANIRTRNLIQLLTKNKESIFQKVQKAESWLATYNKPTKS
ncbi:Deoxyribodipyrimidine photo-lyase-related protein [Criblamydia sequanensis CRIB-18]|uniref:Deoxyribodipyrimidine photo-lyase-related protein n=2 Tax=Candidatus Criblamydia sequanensis TaxID=340071 RepID=A0A090D1H2_9BACT|nr:Deoxyribodipyrimidine photo-lyase-related protein [Criblamydia sequanensis CRIB-18]